MIINLKEARESAGYTLEYIANKLNIRKQYLLALEEGNYDLIPGKIYVEGYTKMYYEFLGINIPAGQEKFLSSNKIVNNAKAIEIGSKYKKYIILCTVILFVLVVISYNFLINLNPEVTDQEEDVTQPDTINGTNEEILSGSNQTD